MYPNEDGDPALESRYIQERLSLIKRQIWRVARRMQLNAASAFKLAREGMRLMPPSTVQTSPAPGYDESMGRVADHPAVEQFHAATENHRRTAVVRSALQPVHIRIEFAQAEVDRSVANIFGNNAMSLLPGRISSADTAERIAALEVLTNQLQALRRLQEQEEEEISQQTGVAETLRTVADCIESSGVPPRAEVAIAIDELYRLCMAA